MAQIQFKGKSFVQNHHLLVKYHELIPKQSKSLTDKVSLHDNLIIHGDNLIALKALLPLYAGKIKCIYIDPPYNTGNEKWAYNDNVNSPMMQEWLGKVVDKEDLTRHDKWLCMMMPRLKLLRQLLREDGVMFISIDNNEFQRLNLMTEELFGEDNKIAEIVWDLGTGTTAGHFTRAHEYVLCYAKDKARVNNFSNPIGNEEVVHGALKKPSAKNPVSELQFPAGMEFDGDNVTFKGKLGGSEWMQVKGEMTFNKGQLVKPVKIEAAWAMKNQVINWLNGEETYDTKGQKIKRFYFNSSGILWYEKDKTILNPPTVLRNIASTKDGTNEQIEIFGKQVLDFPKPSALIAYLIGLVTRNNDIILDSFAGTGTTAHAVLSLNKGDRGNRRFILAECEDYADKITAERVRRVIKGVPNAKDDNLKKGLGGTFSYFELGKAIELESILSGDGLPTYEELARYIFYTATGEEFDPKAMNEKKHFVGESRNYEVYLFYAPDIEKLKNIALTLDRAKSIGKPVEKRRLVFAPTKYLDQAHLDELRIDFAQLPFEIYELAR